MKAHFVTFYSPGTFVAEQTTKPINSWDVQKACKMARKIVERYDAKPYAFTFSTRERGAKDLDSKETKRSGRYFLGGRIMTLDEVKKEMPDQTILITNMEINKFEKIVVNDNSWRSVQPLGKNDTVLPWEK